MIFDLTNSKRLQRALTCAGIVWSATFNLEYWIEWMMVSAQDIWFAGDAVFGDMGTGIFIAAVVGLDALIGDWIANEKHDEGMSDA